MPAPQGAVNPGDLSLIDRWMLSRLAASVAEAERALREYQFATYAQILYDLHWRDFCDWYLEGIKPTVEADAGQRAVLRTALDAILRLAHPVLPFITEAIFEKVHQGETGAGDRGGTPGQRAKDTGGTPVLRAKDTGGTPGPRAKDTGGTPGPRAKDPGGTPGLRAGDTGGTLGPRAGRASIAGIELESRGLLCVSEWPRIDGGADGALRDVDAEQRFERTRALVTAIREVRAQHNVPPRRKVTLHMPPTVAKESGVDTALVTTLAGLGEIVAEGPENHGSESRATFMFDTVELHLSNLADAVDAGAERARLEKQVADLDRSIAALSGRLNNPGYVNKAPAHLVEQTREELDQKQRERAAAAEALGRLG